MTNTNTYSTWRTRLGTFLDVLIVLGIILNTHSVYYFLVGSNNITLYALTAALCLHLVVMPTLFHWEHIKKFLILGVVWGAYIGIYAAVAGGDKLVLLFAKFYVLLLLLCTYFYGHLVRGTVKPLFKHYVDIVFIIALISVFLWFGCSFLKYFPATRPVYIEWGGERRIWSFYGLYFHWQNDFYFHGRQFFRNIGIFTEAPMFSLHLCSALMFDLMINENHSKFRWFRIMWLCGTILTTFSITGYLFMMMIIVIDLYATLITRARSKDEAVSKKAKKQIIAVTALGVVFGAAGLALVADKLASRSGGSRTEDYVNGFKGWRDNVWFGSGFGNIESRVKYASWRRQHRSASGYTNSPMAVLNEGGVWFFMSYYLSFIYSLVVSIMKKDWRMLISLGMLIFLFVTTTFEHTAYIISFIALMLSHTMVGGYKKDYPMLGSKIQ